jgi:ribonuclease Z
MNRELVILGTASQTPTRHRNHNGYFLQFDKHGFLFDPGEGTQRQMLMAGVSASDITRICITHFHGDHALGLPGVLQRMSLDAVSHEVRCHFPAEDGEYFDRLRYATPYWERAKVVADAMAGTLTYDCGGVLLMTAPLDHGIPCQGYRIVEPDGVRMLPDRLAAAGIAGPDVSRLQEHGHLDVGDARVTLESVSETRPGQSFAFLMDTRVCQAAVDLAAGVDLLVIESTFLSSETELAENFGHLTAEQAARIAAEAGVRELVLTHFSQRYPVAAADRFREEASAVFDGPIHLAEDLMRISFPRRR